MEKIVEIDQHIGCAMSGLQADARNLVEHARVECQNHAFHYAEPLRVESTTQAICDLALRFGESGDDEESVMSRPFGVALLIAGYDEDGPQLYALNSKPKTTSIGWRLRLTFLSLDTTPSPRVHSTDMTLRPSALEARAPRPSCRTNTTDL